MEQKVKKTPKKRQRSPEIKFSKQNEHFLAMLRFEASHEKKNPTQKLMDVLLAHFCDSGLCNSMGHCIYPIVDGKVVPNYEPKGMKKLFNVQAATTGRLDSSKPNPGGKPQADDAPKTT